MPRRGSRCCRHWTCRVDRLYAAGLNDAKPTGRPGDAGVEVMAEATEASSPTAQSGAAGRSEISSRRRVGGADDARVLSRRTGNRHRFEFCRRQRAAAGRGVHRTHVLRVFFDIFASVGYVNQCSGCQLYAGNSTRPRRQQRFPAGSIRSKRWRSCAVALRAGCTAIQKNADSATDTAVCAASCTPAVTP